MKVLMIEPGKVPYAKDLNGLAEMQEAVGGLIDVIYPFAEPVAAVCNDEAILLDMPFNRSVPGGYSGIFGPFFLCGLEGDHFCSLTEEQLEGYRQLFHDPEVLIGLCGEDLLTIKVQP